MTPTAFRLIRHGVVASTNELALTAVASGEANDGDVHVALAQTQGRGRRGARWESAAGEGLYASIVLRPPPPPPPPAAVTMTAGLVVLDAVRALGLEGARLKWPNDVLVGDGKLAGILVETRGLDPTAPHFVVGLGVNVSQRTFPPALTRERAVTSLALCDVRTSPDELLARLLEALPQRWQVARERPDALAMEYIDAAGLAGRRVRVSLPEGPVVGCLVGLEPASGLTLDLAEGVRRLVPLEHVRALEVV